jgi:selenocysteine-specific elongation factor
MVLDPAPPALRRRGAAALRAQTLAAADGTTASELDRRGVVPADLLRRLGATGDVPAGTVAAHGWLVSPGRAAELRERLVRFVEETGTSQRPQVPVAQVAQALGLPDERLVAALVTEPLRVVAGAVAPATGTDLPPRLAAGLAALRQDLTATPFRAPDADRVGDLGLSPGDLGALARAGHLLRLADGVVLLPGADDRAVELVGSLDQPFSVSEARGVLDSTRRVVLPLLAHLDRTGRTVRLADDRRRVRG